MKFGFMTFSCPEASWEQVLQFATHYGYEGLEPRIDAKHAHGIEIAASPSDLTRKREQAAAAGIGIDCIATSCRYADPATAGEQVEHTHKCIDLAAAVGAHRLRVFGGGVPGDVCRNSAIEGVSAALRSVADHAAEKDVIVCMETHDDWCNPGHVAAVLEKVNHPAIAVNWDIMHPVTRGGSTMENAFKTLQRWIRHVHIHDGVWHDGRIKMCSIGQGIVNHPQALQMLAKDGYDGMVSGEWIGWSPAEEHLPQEIALLREAAGISK